MYVMYYADFHVQSVIGIKKRKYLVSFLFIKMCFDIIIQVIMSFYSFNGVAMNIVSAILIIKFH